MIYLHWLLCVSGIILWAGIFGLACLWGYAKWDEGKMDRIINKNRRVIP